MANQNKDNGFNFQLIINHIDSVKPRQSGESEINGESVVWGHAVKMKVRNIDLVEDKDFGLKEVESTLEIEIPCDTMTETVELNKFLQGMKVDQRAFGIDVQLPRHNNGQYTTKSLTKGRQFIDMNKK